MGPTTSVLQQNLISIVSCTGTKPNSHEQCVRHLVSSSSKISEDLPDGLYCVS